MSFSAKDSIINRARRYYYLALLLTVAVHFPLLFTSIDQTYDAYVHMFFADHYATHWFENWNYKWYTGFPITSYPPLTHQLIAILSWSIGLELGYIAVAIVALLLFVRGVYVFSQIWVSPLAASLASLLTVFSGSLVEAIHLFGQLPSITGVALLLNACPWLYRYVKAGKTMDLIMSLLIFYLCTSAHHVTTIFGLIFFLFPVIGAALYDRAKEKKGQGEVNFLDFILEIKDRFFSVLLFGILLLLGVILMILPYWLWSKNDPITQVAIPHGSRDSFIEVWSSGLVFFIIPWGMILLALPYIFRSLMSPRRIILGLSFCLLFVLGTGGTTVIPRMLLGDTAFNILTLDRFTFWGSIIALPFWGACFQSYFFGESAQRLRDQLGSTLHRFLGVGYILGILLFAATIVNIPKLIPTQPDKIDPVPIAEFMAMDDHSRWRYMTLGFGDQVAWIAANVDALSVDGNYHSARRLHALTSRRVERLENAKYLGADGIDALQEFVTTPGKYHLKYIFSNDKFYDPLLFFAGWERLSRLDNDIIVWERPGVEALPTQLHRQDIPSYQRMMWGSLPLACLCILLLFLLTQMSKYQPMGISPPQARNISKVTFLWSLALIILMVFSAFQIVKSNTDQSDPVKVAKDYFECLDFRAFSDAIDLIKPDERPDQEIFRKEISTENGLLNSFAKLDTIRIENVRIDGDLAKIDVQIDWMTAVDQYTSDHTVRLESVNGQWFINYQKIQLSPPPNEFFALPEIQYRIQGKRNIYDVGTATEDILDRPEMAVISANLVKKNSDYHIVGLIKNTDNFPAHVDIEALLYDQDDQEMDRYSVQDVMKHHLMPREQTGFRLDFPDVSQAPSRAVLFVSSMVSHQKQFKYLGIKSPSYSDGIVNGFFVNNNAEGVAIPQILTSYWKDDQLIWCDAEYVAKGIKPQTSRYFEIAATELDSVRVIKPITVEDRLVNGHNKDFRNIQHSVPGRQIRRKDYDISLMPNAFVE